LGVRNEMTNIILNIINISSTHTAAAFYLSLPCTYTAAAVIIVSKSIHTFVRSCVYRIEMNLYGCPPFPSASDAATVDYFSIVAERRVIINTTPQYHLWLNHACNLF